MQRAQAQHNKDAHKGQPVPPNIVRVHVGVDKDILARNRATVAEFILDANLYGKGQWHDVLQPTKPDRDQVRCDKEASTVVAIDV